MDARHEQMGIDLDDSSDEDSNEEDRSEFLDGRDCMRNDFGGTKPQESKILTRATGPTS